MTTGSPSMGSGRGPVAREPGEAAQPTQATCHRWPQPRATECAAPCPALHAKTWAACRQVTDGGQKCGQMHPAQAGAITSVPEADIDVMVNGSVMQTKVTEAREGSSPSTINQSTEARFIKPRASSVSARRHAPLVFGVRAGQSNLASGAAGGSPAPLTGESTP